MNSLKAVLSTSNSISTPMRHPEREKSQWFPDLSSVKAIGVFALVFCSNYICPVSANLVRRQLALVNSTCSNQSHSSNEMCVFDPMLTSTQSMYQKMYPEIFGAFLRHTNEKSLTLQRIELRLPEIVRGIKSQCNEEIVMVDLGFGTGNFTSSLASSVHKQLGHSRLKVVGIEKQPKFVAGAKAIFKQNHPLVQEDLRQGNFFTDTIPKDFRHCARIIVASHAFYDYKDQKALTEKVATLAHPQGAIGIYIHESSSKIDAFIKKHMNILRIKVKEDSNPSIEKGLKEANRPFAKDCFSHEVVFPKLEQKEWRKLSRIHYQDFENSYSNLRNEWREVKKLMEFFFQQPLEGLTRSNRTTLVNEFRGLLDENNHRIATQNQIFFIGFNRPDLIDRLRRNL